MSENFDSSDGKRSATALPPALALPPPPQRDRGPKKQSGRPKKVAPKPGTLAYDFRLVPGGVPEVMKFVRMAADSGDEEMRRLSDMYETEGEGDQTQGDLLDRLAAKAKVSPAVIVGHVARLMHSYNRDVARIIAASYQPVIVELAAKEALRGDFDYTAMMLEIGGTKQPGKGGGVSVQVNANASAGAQQDRGLPSFEETCAFVDRVLEATAREPRRLNAAADDAVDAITVEPEPRCLAAGERGLPSSEETLTLVDHEALKAEGWNAGPAEDDRR